MRGMDERHAGKPNVFLMARVSVRRCEGHEAMALIDDLALCDLLSDAAAATVAVAEIRLTSTADILMTQH